jgi:serine-type D-Ala-D-Ala carboxypeptidase (penicillin-binding protein 5/6)
MLAQTRQGLPIDSPRIGAASGPDPNAAFGARPPLAWRAMPARKTIAGVIAGALVAASIALGAPTATAAATPAVRPVVADEPQPLAFLVADADTGAIIAVRNEHQALPPASAMKLVTALAGLEQLPLDAQISVSRLAANQPAMNINMKEGQAWRLDDALHALLMASANDAAYAIAENASGSLEQFAADMQTAGKRWGLRDSTLSDPAGLDAEGEGFRNGSTMSAYDLAVVARNALAVPAIADAAKLLEYDFTDPTGLARTVPNHNDSWLNGYVGATGLKPGFTEKANRTLVATATRDGRTCIAVVLGIYDVDGWAARLNDQCFATPVAAQTAGAHLPPVRVATVDARREAVAGFPRALGAPPLGVAAAADSTSTDPAPTEVAGKQVERNPSASRSAAASASTADPASAGSGGGSWFTLRNLGLFVLFLLAALVLLRRRAVKRRRQRRMARQRMLADARRRGVLHVLDPESAPEVSHVAVVARNGRRPQPTNR